MQGFYSKLDSSPSSSPLLGGRRDGPQIPLSLAVEAEKAQALLQTFSSASLLASGGLGAFCVAADHALQMPVIQNHLWLRAALDNATHGLVGLWSWAVVIGLRKRSDLYEVLLAGLLASIIDLDHFYMAGSLSVKVRGSPVSCLCLAVLPDLDVCTDRVLRLPGRRLPPPAPASPLLLSHPRLLSHPPFPHVARAPQGRLVLAALDALHLHGDAPRPGRRAPRSLVVPVWEHGAAALLAVRQHHGDAASPVFSADVPDGNQRRDLCQTRRGHRRLGRNRKYLKSRDRIPRQEGER